MFQTILPENKTIILYTIFKGIFFGFIVFCVAMCGTGDVVAQEASTTFQVGSDTYFLHEINLRDISSKNNSEYSNPKKYNYNQNIIANREYIYVADHVDNTKDEIVIKRYDAIDGSPRGDLRIDATYLGYYDTDKIDEYVRQAYLVDCNDDDHFILFLNVGYNIIPSTSFEFYFYLVDKSGERIKEYCVLDSNVTLALDEIYNFGIPAVKGNPVNGAFDIFVPMYDGYQMIVGKYTFDKNDKKSSRQSAKSYPLTLVNRNLRKPSIALVDDNHFIIDDYDIYPTLYNCNTGQEVAKFETPHINAHGCKPLQFDQLTFLYTGDIVDVNSVNPNDVTGGKTAVNLGLWDTDTSARQSRQNAIGATSDIKATSGTIDFTNYQPLATVKFGDSTISPEQTSEYSYRQFMAISDYGNYVKHLHFYVPGEFLATYQLNKNMIPTSVDEISGEIGDEISTHKLNYRIADKIITLVEPQSNLSVFNTSGTVVFKTTKPVQEIKLQHLHSGLYILTTPSTSTKIKL